MKQYKVASINEKILSTDTGTDAATLITTFGCYCSYCSISNNAFLTV